MSRSKHIPNPTADDLVAFRVFYKLTPAAAAQLAMSTETQWRFWEDGTRRMHPAIWAWVQSQAGDERAAMRRLIDAAQLVVIEYQREFAEGDLADVDALREALADLGAWPPKG